MRITNGLSVDRNHGREDYAKRARRRETLAREGGGGVPLFFRLQSSPSPSLMLQYPVSDSKPTILFVMARHRFTILWRTSWSRPQSSPAELPTQMRRVPARRSRAMEQVSAATSWPYRQFISLKVAVQARSETPLAVPEMMDLMPLRASWGGAANFCSWAMPMAQRSAIWTSGSVAMDDMGASMRGGTPRLYWGCLSGLVVWLRADSAVAMLDPRISLTM